VDLNFMFEAISGRTMGRGMFDWGRAGVKPHDLGAGVRA